MGELHIGGAVCNELSVVMCGVGQVVSIDHVSSGMQITVVTVGGAASNSETQLLLRMILISVIDCLLIMIIISDCLLIMILNSQIDSAKMTLPM